MTGIDTNEEAVRLARGFVANRNLANVHVIHADARATGLPRGAFDFATARLVLVNVPYPEQIVAEMVALVRPGGIVALYEADWLGSLCDPPLPAWNRALDLLHAYSSMNGIDLFIGRRIPRMLREAGLSDIQVNPLIRVSAQGHDHRTVLPHFVENLRERLLEKRVVSEDELTHLVGELQRHIDDPRTLVVGAIFFQAWGRRPRQGQHEANPTPR